MYIKKEQEWFIALIQHLGKLLPRAKDHTDLINQIFSIYEEGMIDILDDQAHIPGKLIRMSLYRAM